MTGALAKAVNPESNASRPKPRVLLVDDQPAVAQIIGAIISEHPDIVFAYVDSAAALQKAIEFKPTVILQDLSMPETDGLDLVRQYRADPQINTVPVIILTVAEDPKIKAQAFYAGASDYIVKLPDKLELIARIRHHSVAYVSLSERDAAFRFFLHESRHMIAESNLDLRRLATLGAELHKLVVCDPISGLANWRRFDDAIKTEWARARREKQPAALLLCDIDLFKLYVESNGVEAGDECIRKIAGVISTRLKRPADLAACHDDEFAILLPNTDSNGAMIVAQACRAGVEALAIPSAWSPTNALTISISVASMVPPQKISYDELIWMANCALENAKTYGRNLVRLARPRLAKTRAEP